MDSPAQTAAAARPTPRDARGWIAALWPTALLVPLAWLPFDLITSLAWTAGFVAAVVSLWRGSRALLALRRGAAVDRPDLWRWLVSVALFASAVALCVASVARADAVARELAARMQQRCDEARACPDAPEGWSVVAYGDGVRSHAGLTSVYELRYSTSEDRSAFWIRVFHDIDHTLIITGGVGSAVSEREFAEPEFGEEGE